MSEGWEIAVEEVVTMIAENGALCLQGRFRAIRIGRINDPGRQGLYMRNLRFASLVGLRGGKVSFVNCSQLACD